MIMIYYAVGKVNLKVMYICAGLAPEFRQSIQRRGSGPLRFTMPRAEVNRKVIFLPPGLPVNFCFSEGRPASFTLAYCVERIFWQLRFFLIE